MSARTNKVDEDPNGILLGYLRLFCFDPCGEKEADTEEREEGDSCPVDEPLGKLNQIGVRTLVPRLIRSGIMA